MATALQGWPAATLREVVTCKGRLSHPRPGPAIVRRPQGQPAALVAWKATRGQATRGNPCGQGYRQQGQHPPTDKGNSHLRRGGDDFRKGKG
ncbi:hypothetical protein B296_00024968 [Ensete ventricosum]|uniref:Uncharacterized protein n=1 Tax=Ensete ventricosum TaxID=4639 RepID=A0A426X4B7_ENSVE|nr:hypothetical protein B296_00024968 [Ensete ventricosum]